MPYDVYGVGNALVDVQARISDELLESLDYAKGIMTLVDEATQQRVLSRLEGMQLNRCAGGSAANTILGIAGFGGNAAYAGKVANDLLGDFCLNDMREMGVSIDVPQDQGQTGTCVVLITKDAQRTMLTNLGISSQLGPADVDETKIRESEYIYVEGYLFNGESTRLAALRAIEMAKAAGTSVAFTVSDPFLIGLYREEFWELIRGPVDLLFCNLEEARALTGQEDPIDCGHEIHRYCRNAALTLGEAGSIIMHGGEAIPIEGVPVEAVDTTGAGDMYAAGLLYGITNGLTWQQSGHLASHAAARIVSQLGARLDRAFTAAEIEALVS